MAGTVSSTTQAAMSVPSYAPRMALTSSYWPADTSEEVHETTIGDVLREAARAAPDRTALVAGMPNPADRRRWTYAELLRDAEMVARSLLTSFAPGEHLAAWAPNIPEWVILQYGAALAGLVLVTVNPAYTPTELEYVLRQSRAAGLFLLPEYRTNPMAKSLESVRPGLPDLREAILFTEWQGFLASAARAEPSLPEVRPGDAAALLYTSGTTGFPKGAVLNHRGMTNDARFIAQRWGMAEGDVMVNPMPLFHAGGCVMAVLGAVAQLGTYVPVLAFDPALVLELIETERAALSGGVPTMLIAMMEHPDLARRDLSSLRSVASGGAPVPADLVRRIEATLDVRFAIVFGQTECMAVATMTCLDDTPEDKAETVGVALPQIDVKVTDPVSGEVVPPGTLGQLCIRGFSVMNGYYDMPEATASAINVDGWLHTGDLSPRDRSCPVRASGRIRCRGRRGARRTMGRAGRRVRPSGRRCSCDPGTIVRPRPRALGGLQGAPVLGVRRCLPADRLGQDPEVRAPRAVREGRARAQLRLPRTATGTLSVSFAVRQVAAMWLVHPWRRPTCLTTSSAPAGRAAQWRGWCCWT
jgi:fatty-acyl-CoA synthase